MDSHHSSIHYYYCFLIYLYVPTKVIDIIYLARNYDIKLAKVSLLHTRQSNQGIKVFKSEPKILHKLFHPW